MKKMKSRLLAGLLSMTMVFSAAAVPIEALAATDTSGHWAESSINAWIARGYVTGYPDGTFRPNNPISRAEFVAMANKAFGFTNSRAISFSDVQPGYWAYAEIQKGVAAGYVQGDTQGTFRPGSAVSRQEAAVMLANLKGYSDNTSGANKYTDRWAMANWAVGSIGAVSERGIMSGYPDGTFKPQRAMTRAEAVSVLQKAANTATISNNNSTAPVYVTPSSNTSTSTTGSYGSSDTFNGTILDGTTLEGRTLTKDLLIPSSVGSQTVTLKNVRMKNSTLYVEGGGDIVLKNCDINKVVMRKSNAVLKNDGDSDIEEVRFEEKGRINGRGYNTVLIDDDSVSQVIIDASIDTLKLDAEVELRLYANADIDTFEITRNADQAKIKIGEDAEVMDMQVYDKVRISGKGKIDTMTVYVSGVKSEIEPRRLILQDGAKKPNYNYSDHDDDDDDYDDLTLDTDNERFDGDGDKYDRVEIDAEDVKLSDITVYDDLTITRNAGDSTIRLEDVSIRGNVYIEGGGDNSVIFDNCSISGSIYSRKRSGEPVAIRLQDTPVRGNVYINGETLLESDDKLNSVIVNTSLSDTFVMDADASKLLINQNCSVQLKGNVDTVEVASGLSDVKISMNGGKVGTLTSYSPLKLEGSGTIDKLLVDSGNLTNNSSITIGSTGTPEGGGSTATTYTITSSITSDGVGTGSITPNGSVTVTKGGLQAYTITADTASHIAKIQVDGTDVALNGNKYQTYTYTFRNVGGNHTIAVTFGAGAGSGNGSGESSGNGSENPETGDYKLEAFLENNHGDITPSTILYANEGEDKEFTFTAHDGYYISNIVIDKDNPNGVGDLVKVSQSGNNYKSFTYVFKGVKENHTVHVTFAEGDYGIDKGEMNSNENNELNPSGKVTYSISVDAKRITSGGIEEEMPKEVQSDGRTFYYCIAGDTIKLEASDFKVEGHQNPQTLELRWGTVSNTTGMQYELNQEDSETTDEAIATLQTKGNSGYSITLKPEVYDESGNKIENAFDKNTAYIILNVGVPLESMKFGVVNGEGGVTGEKDNPIQAFGSSSTLSDTNLRYGFEPTTAGPAQSSWYSSFQWSTVAEVDGKSIDDIMKESMSDWTSGSDKDTIRIDTSDKGTQTLVVQKYQYDADGKKVGTNTVTPKGLVPVQLTIPNGRGNNEDFTHIYWFNFTGNTTIVVEGIWIDPNNNTAINGKTTTNLEDMLKPQVTPSTAPHHDVTWEFVKSKPEGIATLEDGINLVTTGAPGEVTVQPIVKDGLGQGKNFRGTEITIQVDEVDVTKVTLEREGTAIAKAGDTVSFKVSVESDNASYQEPTKWEKTVNGVTSDITDKIQKDDTAGYYTYTVEETDYKTGGVYEKNEGSFTTTIEKGGENDTDVESNEVKVIFQKPTPEAPDLTNEETDKGFTIKKGTGEHSYIISGADSITLPEKAGEDTITWSVVDSLDSSVANWDNTTRILTTTGRATMPSNLEGKEMPIKLKAEFGNSVGDSGITYTFNVEFVPATLSFDMEVNGMEFSNGGIVAPKQEITLIATVDDNNASYLGYGAAEFSWVQSNSVDGASTEIGTGKRLIVTAPDSEQSVYYKCILKNGALNTGGNRVTALTSEPKYVVVKSNTGKTTVTGLDFSAFSDMTVESSKDPTYTATIESAKDININFGQIRYVGEDGQSVSLIADDIAISQITNDSQDTIKLDGAAKTLTIDKDAAGKIKIQIQLADAKYQNSSGSSYTATLEITVKQATPSTTTNSIIAEDELTAGEDTVIETTTDNEEKTTGGRVTSNTETTTAVTDVDFSKISGLVAPLTPEGAYVVQSQANQMTVIALRDTETTKGAVVVPENARAKEITWSVSPETPSTVTEEKPEQIEIIGIGTLDTKTGVLQLKSGVTGSVKLVATVKDGVEDGVDFVKELPILIEVGTQTADTQTTQNTTRNTNNIPKITTNHTSMPDIPNSTNTNTNTNPSGNMTQANKRQVVSTGTTQVGTSSVTSAATSRSGKNQNGFASSVPNNTSNADDLKITYSDARVNRNIRLRAISTSTKKEFTDVEWAVSYDAGTDAKFVSDGVLRASQKGYVTVTATAYTQDGEKIVKSMNIVIW